MDKKRNLKNGSFWKSFKCALRGIFSCDKERNLKIHLIFFMLVLFFGVFFSISVFEWLIIFAVSGLVMALELVNTSIEEVCDRLRDDLGMSYEATAKARDVAAGAVLIAAFFAACCGLVIFVPRGVGFLVSCF